MQFKQPGVLGRMLGQCRPWAGPVAALGLMLAGCTEFEDELDFADEEEVEERGAVKGFEKEFELATQDTLFIQLFDSEYGNVRITEKVPVSTQDSKKQSFILRGPEESPFLMRDDGKLGDVQAGDQVFTALAKLDLKDLETRVNEDKAAFEKEKVTSAPVFRNRIMVGEMPAKAFDLDSFLGGKVVALTPSIWWPWWSPAAVKSRSLMITNTLVVNDPTRTHDPCTNPGGDTPGGAWTFGRLMTEMAGPNPPGDFVEDWLDQWNTNQTIGSFTAPARPNVQSMIITPWKNASGGGTLDLTLAPFRLLAIVNRVDLRGSGPGYGGGDAGELRFVFGLLDSTCTPQPMTVILEYKVPRRGCHSVREWAQKWYALRTMTPGSAAYNNALAALVEEVVVAGAPGVPANAPNDSAIGQVRTNEIALAVPWELREFRLGQPSDPDNLIQTTVGLTPHDGFKPVQLNDGPGVPGPGEFPPATVSGSVAIDNYVNSNLGTLCPSVPVLPRHQFLGSNAALLGASSLSPGDPDQPPPFAFVFWKLLNLSNSALSCERHTLSVNTCNGCHAGETLTRNFLHVNSTVPVGAPATLSGFLNGINVPDPAVGTPVRTFNDLTRRANDLHGLALSSCFAFPHLSVEAAQSLKSQSSLPSEDSLFTKGKFTDVVVEDLRHEPPLTH